MYTLTVLQLIVAVYSAVVAFAFWTGLDLVDVLVYIMLYNICIRTQDIHNIGEHSSPHSISTSLTYCRCVKIPTSLQNGSLLPTGSATFSPRRPSAQSCPAPARALLYTDVQPRPKVRSQNPIFQNPDVTSPSMFRSHDTLVQRIIVNI